MNYYGDVRFWKLMYQTEEARHSTNQVWRNDEPGKPPRTGLTHRVVLGLLRMAGLAEQPAEPRPVVEEAAAREGCRCGGDREFEEREPALDSDGEWALRCPACGHLDRLLWLSGEARPLVLGLARRRGWLRLRRPESARSTNTNNTKTNAKTKREKEYSWTP